MTIAELKALIDAAIERGINPTTTVVIDIAPMENPADAVWPILGEVHDPSTDTDYIWFTLTPSNIEADTRFTEGFGN
jgi:hypothetical protein